MRAQVTERKDWNLLGVKWVFSFTTKYVEREFENRESTGGTTVRADEKSCQSPALHESVKRKDSLVLVIKWLCIFKETLEMAQGSSCESRHEIWGSGGCPGESKDSGTLTARK